MEIDPLKYIDIPPFYYFPHASYPFNHLRQLSSHPDQNGRENLFCASRGDVMAKAVVQTLFPVAVQQDEASLESRYTDELVIALVGPVGSGATKTADLLKEILERTYGYTATYLKVSQLISESAPVVGERYTANLEGHQRVERLQAIGSKLRAQVPEAFLAEKCVEKIAIDRHAQGGYEKHGENLVPLPRRHVHIIDSLKHPAEVQLLRDVYGETF